MCLRAYGVLIVLTVGCGSEVTEVETGAGAGGAASTSTGVGGVSVGGAPAGGATPPPVDTGAPGPDGPGYTYAISRLFLGDTDFAGNAAPTAWQSFGYDLDGLTSSADSTQHCVPYGNASPKTIYPDGMAGRDNGWGKNLLPIFFGLFADFGAQANEAILAGTTTTLFVVPGLGAGSAYQGLSATVTPGASRDSPPAFDGSDSWPRHATGTPVSGAYVTGDVLVLPVGELTLDLVAVEGGIATPFPLREAVITMELAPDRQSAQRGIIAGIMDVEEYLDEMRPFWGAVDPTICSGATLASIEEQLRGAADILAGATQTVGETCDHIAVGLGFEAVAVSVGETVADPPPTPDPCGG